MTRLSKNKGTRELNVSFVESADVDWSPVVSLRRESLPALDALKRRLLEAHLGRADESLHPWLHRAADDAVSLAWTVPFPWLVLPDLLTEKIEQALRRARFQRDLLDRGSLWTSLAA